jgi:hypothetical protein
MRLIKIKSTSKKGTRRTRTVSLEGGGELSWRSGGFVVVDDVDEDDDWSDCRARSEGGRPRSPRPMLNSHEHRMV